MPPKKTFKLEPGNKFNLDRINPRVVLRPLQADSPGHSRYRHTGLPPTAALFKQHEFSDIKLRVGDTQYYAHKLILCAASDVFAKMLGGNWAENSSSELELQEEEECVKVFERFLYYFYSGTIVISDSYVIPLFMLADKYNVKPLYAECVKVIITGLKVYMVTKSSPGKSRPSLVPGPSTTTGPSTSYEPISSSSSFSESSDSDSSDDLSGGVGLLAEDSTGAGTVSTLRTRVSTSAKSSKPVTHLAASETFPLSLVMKMLMYCQNEQISSAALYNLEARLAKHILHDNFGVWNDLELTLLLRLLSDTHFYCNEFTLYKAARSWLQYDPTRLTGDTPAHVLSCIRYPNLEPHELYDVEKDEFLQTCEAAVRLVQQAIRFGLFRHCCKAEQLEDWTGPQFVPRQIKPQ